MSVSRLEQLPTAFATATALTIATGLTPAGTEVRPDASVMVVDAVPADPFRYQVDGQTTVSVGRPWARRFSADAAATVVASPEELQPVRDAVGSLIRRGNVVITGVDVEGHSSGEDDSWMRRRDSVGIETPSALNVALGNTRARVNGPAIRKTVADAAGYRVPLGYLPGVEEVDASLAAEVSAAAKRLGVSTLRLVSEFSRHPERTPVAARTALGQLAAGRRVDAIIKHRQYFALPVVLPTAFVKKPEVRKGMPPAALGEHVLAYPDGKPQTSPVTMEPQHVPPVARRQIQPRNYNFSKNGPGNGRMARSHGGNRSCKRG